MDDCIVVTRLLTEMKVEFVVDDTCETFAEILDDAKDNVAKVVTSESVKKDYDRHHPERISCFIFIRDSIRSVTSYKVITKNRVQDPSSLKIFFDHHATVARKSECNVCFKDTPISKVIACSTCLKHFCVKCHGKIAGGEAFKCPCCRTWNLFGDSFGLPRPMLGPMSCSMGTNSGVGEFVNGILGKLDGTFLVVPRVKNNIFLPGLEMTRLSFTTRFTKDSVKLRDVRRILEKMVQKKRNVFVYVIRDTFAIEEMPVQERSMFRITPHRCLQQDPDAWIDVIGDDVNRKTLKVAYAEPDVPELPGGVKKIADIFPDLFGSVAVSTEPYGSMMFSSGGDGMDFDVDASGNILTMHEKMAASRLAMFLERKANVKILWRRWGGDARDTIEFSLSALARTPALGV
jgi:hypothetical protein